MVKSFFNYSQSYELSWSLVSLINAIEIINRRDEEKLCKKRKGSSSSIIWKSFEKSEKLDNKDSMGEYFCIASTSSETDGYA